MADQVWAEPSEELHDLITGLTKAPRRVGARTSLVIRKSGLDIEADAKVLAPVDTGNLRSLISTSVEGDGRSAVMAAEVGPEAEYGAHVEYGTARQAPQPYLLPAFERHTPTFLAVMQQVAATMLDES